MAKKNTTPDLRKRFQTTEDYSSLGGSYSKRNAENWNKILINGQPYDAGKTVAFDGQESKNVFGRESLGSMLGQKPFHGTWAEYKQSGQQQARTTAAVTGRPTTASATGRPTTSSVTGRTYNSGQGKSTYQSVFNDARVARQTQQPSSRRPAQRKGNPALLVMILIILFSFLPGCLSAIIH